MALKIRKDKTTFILTVPIILVKILNLEENNKYYIYVNNNNIVLSKNEIATDDDTNVCQSNITKGGNVYHVKIPKSIVSDLNLENVVFFPEVNKEKTAIIYKILNLN